MANTISGQEIASTGALTSQVYKATHKGEHSLPFMNRSFISFSFGGKNIEDFNLIAYTDGDTMEKEGYATFTDLTSTYDVLHGQFLWGTYYKNNSITFNLVGDAITQRQLDEFKHWFQAGKVRELILAEHPNRAIMAHVSEPPHLSLLPFEKQIDVRLGNSYYKTSTTEYRGTIQLSLVMDDPLWYAKINIFGHRDEQGIYRDTWYDVRTNSEHSVLDIPDAIKILYEDGIPLSSMITSTMLLGSNIFASVNYQMLSRIVSQSTISDYEANSTTIGYYNNGNVPLVGETTPRAPWQYYKGAVIATMDGDRYITGSRIAGAIMNDENGVSYLAPYSSANPTGTTISFYYAGTAPSPANIKFNLTPIITTQNGSYYITSPCNSYASNILGKKYNTITFEGCEEKHEFNFTTPNIYTSFNEVMRLFDNDEVIAEGLSWATVREFIREMIWHSEVRAWANRVIDALDDEDGQGLIGANEKQTLKLYMSYFLIPADGTINNLLPAHFSFDAKTGESVGEIQHRSCFAADGSIIYFVKPENASQMNEAWANYCKYNIVTSKENVGDMVKSKYLIIEEKNYPNEYNNIVAWQAGERYAHRMYHNVSNGISNIYVDYKNLYL